MKTLITLAAVLSISLPLLADGTVTYPAGDGVNEVTVTTNEAGYITSQSVTTAYVPEKFGTNVVMSTQYADGSTNLWTQADLADALGLMNRKYWRDMETEQGRRNWHGNQVGQYLVTNSVGNLSVVRLYADGFAHTTAASVPKAKTADPEAAAKAKAQAEAVRAAWEAKNLPPEIAALRAAQREAAKTNTVTVIYSN